MMSKRQQARNEKVLQELVQNVPGNNLCADCAARNPAWASWSLGIFLCMRCASLHRKLGTHISKVKSLSMDSWTVEQVENMKKVGNASSNKAYNPQNKKPPMPVDADEADSAMERFIRAKYVTHSLNGVRRSDTASQLSAEDTPPPLPPKTGKFGLRSASSLFPLSSKARKQAAGADHPPPSRDSMRSPSPHLPNKPSKVFGASVEYGSDDTENKLARLRDMGFMDTSRNAVILKGVNGNLEKAVETLVRLGEGNSRSPSLVSPRESSLRATRSLTPLTTRPATTNGHYTPITPSTAASTNPFDHFPPQPQTAQSTGTLQNKNPYFPSTSSSTNPFGAPTPPVDPLTQAFQNMSLVPPQPLFPNHTGGIPAQVAQSPYQQTSAPAPAVPPAPFNTHQTYPQPQAQAQAQTQFTQQSQPQAQQQMVQNGYVPTSAQSTPGIAYNPFFSSPVQQAAPQALALNTTASPVYAHNPFTRSPTRIQSPTLGQIPEQSQYLSQIPEQTQYAGQIPEQSQYVTGPPAAQPNNPFYTPPQPMQSMHTSQRPDKASILALYNYPHLAPQPIPTPEQPSADIAPVPAVTSLQQQQPRSASTPLPGNKNPFYLGNGAPSGPGPSPLASKDVFVGGGGHSSRDSIALGLDMASWSNSGRHSPDAFASLSARHA